jgi:hypothetical protein
MPSVAFKEILWDFDVVCLNAPIILKPFEKVAALLIWNIALVELNLERLTEGCGNG